MQVYSETIQHQRVLAHSTTRLTAGRPPPAHQAPQRLRRRRAAGARPGQTAPMTHRHHAPTSQSRPAGAVRPSAAASAPRAPAPAPPCAQGLQAQQQDQQQQRVSHSNVGNGRASCCRHACADTRGSCCPNSLAALPPLCAWAGAEDSTKAASRSAMIAVRAILVRGMQQYLGGFSARLQRLRACFGAVPMQQLPWLLLMELPVPKRPAPHAASLSRLLIIEIPARCLAGAAHNDGCAA